MSDEREKDEMGDEKDEMDETSDEKDESGLQSNIREAWVLSRRVGELWPSWADIAGVAAIDPQHGFRWRRVGGDGGSPLLWIDESMGDWTMLRRGHELNARIVSAGPDWRDGATRGALLMAVVERRSLDTELLASLGDPVALLRAVLVTFGGTEGLLEAG